MRLRQKLGDNAEEPLYIFNEPRGRVLHGPGGDHRSEI